MIRIITDSVASMPAEVARQLHIDVLSMHMYWKGADYVDAEMDVDAFYERIHEMVDDIPSSSQPSVGDAESLLEGAAKHGDDVLGVFISSKMSGTFETISRAARAVKDRYADFSYALVDSTSNSFEEAFAAFNACAVRDAGGTLEQCAQAMLDTVSRTRWLFTPESLRFLRANGRIGRASALLGSLVKICPVLTVKDFETSTFAKVRTQAKALARIADKFDEDVRRYGLANVVVHYIGDKAPALKWAHETIEPLAGREVDVIPVSPVIGVHVGPALGIIYECTQKIDGKFSGKPDELVACSN